MPDCLGRSLCTLHREKFSIQEALKVLLHETLKLVLVKQVVEYTQEFRRGSEGIAQHPLKNVGAREALSQTQSCAGWADAPVFGEGWSENKPAFVKEEGHDGP